MKTIPLGAAPGDIEYFDYVTVDAAGSRVYIAHGTEVKVIDANNFSVVGSITGLKRCHGVALVAELGKGFITDGDAAKVLVFDIKSLKITGEIKTGFLVLLGVEDADTDEDLQWLAQKIASMRVSPCFTVTVFFSRASLISRKTRPAG